MYDTAGAHHDAHDDGVAGSRGEGGHLRPGFGGSGVDGPGLDGPGFDGPGFDLHRDEVSTAEIAELREIRAELIAQAGVIAGAEARRVRLMARATEIARARMARVTKRSLRGQEMELRSIAAEFAFALRESDRTMLSSLGDAEQLLRLFPATVAALGQGRVSRAHATAILDVGCRIDDGEARAAFEHVVIEYAESTTASRTRAFARGLAERLNPRSIDERFAEAATERRVTVTELDDGMARLEALLPAVVAFGVYDRLTRGAKAIHEADLFARRAHAGSVGDARGSDAAVPPSRDARVPYDEVRDDSRADPHDDARDDGRGATGGGRDGGNRGGDESHRFDERSRDQVRADLFADLLLTGAPRIDPTVDRSPGGIGAIRAHVQITVPVTTVTGTTVGGGELNGRAPVDTDTARRLAGDAPGWDRVMTDPVRGTVLDVDRYEPSASQRRFLVARDVHCRCPGCRQPAHRCDLDHNDEHQHGGRTRIDNLAHLCVGHHTMKTETAWTVRQRAGGSLEWTSPLGFSYVDDPPPRVVFVPDGDDRPAPSVGARPPRPDEPDAPRPSAARPKAARPSEPRPSEPRPRTPRPSAPEPDPAGSSASEPDPPGSSASEPDPPGSDAPF